MDQADTYIRSSTMEEQDQIIEEETTTFAGAEWLKTVLFMLLIFLIGFVSIRMVGPMIFTDYLPGILGLDGVVEEPLVEDPVVEPIDEEEDTEEETIDDSSAVDDGQDAVDDSETIVEESEGDSAGKPETESGGGDEEVAEPIVVELYIVQAGDTLTSIAEAHELTVEEIIAVNEFLNPHYLQLGQEILIPKKSSKVIPEPEG